VFTIGLMDEHGCIFQPNQVLLLQTLQRINDLLSTSLIGKLENKKVAHGLNSFHKYEQMCVVSVLSGKFVSIRDTTVNEERFRIFTPIFFGAKMRLSF
jgi:hypothetical protein